MMHEASAAGLRKRDAERARLYATVIRALNSAAMVAAAFAALLARLGVICFGWNHILAPTAGLGHIGLVAAWVLHALMRLVQLDPTDTAPLTWKRIGSSICQSIVLYWLFVLLVWATG